ARARLGVEDHELARQRDQADEDHGLDLDDAVPTQHHAHDGMLELHRDQERHDHAEHTLEYLVIQGIEGIEDQQREDDDDELEQGHHDDDGNYRRQNKDDDLLEALVNRHQPPLGANLVKGRVARFFMHKLCAPSFNETLMERGVR